jgi:hypothetical protein
MDENHDMDENQDMDGIIFYHPYRRQCFPLTWMNIKTWMELSIRASVLSIDMDEIIFIIHTGVSTIH